MISKIQFKKKKNSKNFKVDNTIGLTIVIRVLNYSKKNYFLITKDSNGG